MPANTPVAAERIKPTLRPYQAEDFSAVIAAHAEHQCVIGQAATGLGKAVLLAALAGHYAAGGGIVLILVDVRTLVRQLAQTVKWFTGSTPEIEMGDERADLDPSATLYGAAGNDDGTGQIVVSSVQSQYSGSEGRERFRRFDASKIVAVLLDECELFLAPKARSVVDYFLTANPKVRLFGCTATPNRTDGVAMANLFNHVAFKRDIRWGIAAGWLCPARQAFVRVSIDFSTLDLRKGKDGEIDYVEEQLAQQLVENESALIELAEGIIAVAGDRKSIVVCPDVASARAVAHYLERKKGGCAKCVYGEMGDAEKVEVMAGHRRNDFQFLTSVMMLCLDDQTEILTTAGWRGMNEIKDDDFVANWSQGRVYFEKPIRVVSRPRMPDEDMAVATGCQVNIRVTGGHDMLVVADRGKGKTRKVKARELIGKQITVPASGMAEPIDVRPIQPAVPTQAKVRRMVSYTSSMMRKNGWNDEDSRTEASARISRIHSLRRKNPSELTLAECRFIGFWIGDGSVQELSTGGVNYTLCQSVAYPKIIAWVDSVIRELGIDFRRDEKWAPSARRAGDRPHILWGFPRGTGSGPQARNGLFHLEPYLDKGGSHLLWGLNEDQFDAVVFGYWMADGQHGDGSVTPLTYVFADTKKSWLDLLQAIGCTRGYRTRLSPIKLTKNKNWKQQYVLSMRKCSFYRITHTTLKSEIEYKPEAVWCVETSSGNIITRRGGRVTVMGNCKGYDDRTIRAVFVCRKTKSNRLYVQIVGRGIRPECEGLEAADSVGARLALIAASDKPDALIVNLVGISERVRDVTLIDVLGVADPIGDSRVADRAKDIQWDEGLDVAEAVARAEEEIEEERAVERCRAEAEAAAQERADEDEAARRIRRLVQVEANVDVEWQGNIGDASGTTPHIADDARLQPKTLACLRKNKVPDDIIAKLSPDEAVSLTRKLAYRWKAGLCSFAQGAILKRAGYTRQEIEPLTRDAASSAIDEVKANGWRRRKVSA